MRFFYAGIFITVLFFACNSEKEGRWVPSSDNAHFYAYPLRDSFSKRDSFQIASDVNHFFNSFEEDNISFSLPRQPIYRLVYSPNGLDCYSAILTLTNEKMIIKETASGCPYSIRSIEKLDSQIHRNINLITDYFLLEYKDTAKAALFRDSVNKIYPNAISFLSYQEYEKAVYNFSNNGFRYTTRSVPLSQEQYHGFIRKIDSAGYWTMPITDERCIGETMHQGSSLLEAAVYEKYKNVKYRDCSRDSSAFKKVINELLAFSGIERRYLLWREDHIKKK